MSNAAKQIADKARGIAAEKRFTQDHIATALGLARSSVNARMNGGTRFYADELWVLATELGVDITRFYPSPSSAPPAAGDGALAPHESPGA